VTSRGYAAPARQSRAADSHRLSIVVVIGLAAAVRLARDRRTYEHVIVVAIGLAAAVSLARDNQSRSLARLAAWDKRPKPSEVHVIKTRRA